MYTEADEWIQGLDFQIKEVTAKCQGLETEVKDLTEEHIQLEAEVHDLKVKPHSNFFVWKMFSIYLG